MDDPPEESRRDLQVVAQRRINQRMRVTRWWSSTKVVGAGPRRGCAPCGQQLQLVFGGRSGLSGVGEHGQPVTGDLQHVSDQLDVADYAVVELIEATRWIRRCVWPTRVRTRRCGWPALRSHRRGAGPEPRPALTRIEPTRLSATVAQSRKNPSGQGRRASTSAHAGRWHMERPNLPARDVHSPTSSCSVPSATASRSSRSLCSSTARSGSAS